MRKKKQGRIETNRRVAGLYVKDGNPPLPQAYLVYEVSWSDGTTALERGRTLHTYHGAPRTAAQRRREKEETHPGMIPILQAIAALQAKVQFICRDLDGQLAPITGRPKGTGGRRKSRK
ncbi:MAG: hypothetical protein Q7R39_02380 [Dehalococcoidia bacterium]|nr:hypothetical protein [Dehalococcoidia bacterium]